MADNMINISIRINRDDKAEFEKICNELGFSMSTALNMYIKSVNRTKSVNFALPLEPIEPKKEN